MAAMASTGSGVPRFGPREVHVSGFRIRGVGCGFRVSGLGVLGFGLRVKGKRSNGGPTVVSTALAQSDSDSPML